MHEPIMTGNGESGIPIVPMLMDGKSCSGCWAHMIDSITGNGNKFSVGIADWPQDYPYIPEVTATLAHDNNYLFCFFQVRERHVRVATLDDNGPVWEDSCVELFIADADGRHYYNFETNAAGVALASRRVSRTECVHFPPEKMERIIRISSLPKEKTDIRDDAGIEWSLLVGIPFDLFSDPIPGKLDINIYKCGDKTDTPHFLSWAPIETPSPDFHRPEFFRTVKLA